MNSGVTLVNDSPTMTSKGQVRLLYKRMDQQNAVLVEDNSPKYFLTTSDDSVSKVKIRDAAQQTVAEVNRRVVLSDTLTLTNRNGGKPMKATDVLRKAPSTSDGQTSTALRTEEGTYYWRKRRGHHWGLYEDSSSTPVAWTETVPDSAPTWVLVLESHVLGMKDYVLISLFYLKGQSESVDGWEHVDGRTAWLCTK